MTTSREVQIPYGHSRRSARIPAAQLAWIVSPADAPAVPDVAAAVHTAIHSPIESASLGELVRRHGKNVVLLADDSTRPTPQHLLLPPLIDELNAAGVPDGHITVLIALGTHRKMTPDEFRSHYGDAVVDRVRVENLDSFSAPPDRGGRMM